MKSLYTWKSKLDPSEGNTAESKLISFTMSSPPFRLYPSCYLFPFGLVNGARGVVVGFESEEKGLPKVRFLCGVTQVIKMEKWVFKGPSGVHLSCQQLPLKLAWAISIHKSQGMSLHCLRVLDFDSKVERADPSVLQFYKQLRRHQLLTQDSLQTHSDADEKENWNRS
ncbi:hypothetical protein AV530_007761 [Patagioenas fasciata monilis]|uniref:ATP-dependent DNA helicase PIF1 n=1 Tax=Patagioenas fasciata monilis TaxID=372326 RepID=A0A1V4JZ11_PATFA|nr:hypothetical protein AV530_007761 [Patagioenas fasciata monilis]